MTLGEIQMSGITLMFALAITLTVLSAQWGRKRRVNRTAGLMLVGGLALLAFHFILQYAYHIRDNYGLMTAVLVNLVFFLPVNCMVNFSLLYLQRQGHLKRSHWIVGPVSYVAMLGVLLAGLLMSDKSAVGNTSYLHTAEAIAAGIYGLTQLYYNWEEYHGYRLMRHAVEQYLDPERSELINWVFWSMALLAICAITLPMAIFMSSVITSAFYVLMIFGTLYYYSISFICYNVSNAANLVRKASHLVTDKPEKKFAAEPASVAAAPVSDHTVAAITAWVNKRGFTRTSLSLPQVASEMGIAPRKLEAWVRGSDYEKFATWISHLRIEEACRIMTEHPNYTNEAVAEACGFNSTSYYHRTFRTLKGMKPSDWMRQHRASN